MVRVQITGAAELTRRIKRMGAAASPAVRRAGYQIGQELTKTFKNAAENAGFKKPTGATKRSLGVYRLKDGTVKAGVRYNYRDKKTGKIPNRYAFRVNKTNPWFTRAWESTQDSVAGKYIANLRKEIMKAA